MSFMSKKQQLFSFALLLLLSISAIFALTVYDDPNSTENEWRVRNFDLLDSSKKHVRLQDFKGRWVLTFFGFTRCPEICPTALYDVTDLLVSLGPNANALQPIFISVDPEYDTPEVLNRYMANFDDRIIGLTGSISQIDAAKESFGTFSRKHYLEDGSYTVDHSAAWSLINPQGLFVRVFTSQMPPLEIASRIEAIMGGAQ
jgi:protein SCO1